MTDTTIKAEAQRRLLQQEAQRRKEDELQQQKTEQERDLQESRIREERTKLYAEEEMIRIKARQLALEDEARRLANEKEKAIEAEMERLRNRTPVEILQDKVLALTEELDMFKKAMVKGTESQITQKFKEKEADFSLVHTLLERMNMMEAAYTKKIIEVEKRADTKLLQLANRTGNTSLGFRKSMGQTVRKFKQDILLTLYNSIQIIFRLTDEKGNNKEVWSIQLCQYNTKLVARIWKSVCPNGEFTYDVSPKKTEHKLDKYNVEEDVPVAFYIELKPSCLVFKIGALCKTIDFEEETDIFNPITHHFVEHSNRSGGGLWGVNEEYYD